jgi:hypothetical protein
MFQVGPNLVIGSHVLETVGDWCFFSLSNTGLGVAKLMDIGSKLLATVGVALNCNYVSK